MLVHLVQLLLLSAKFDWSGGHGRRVLLSELLDVAPEAGDVVIVARAYGVEGCGGLRQEIAPFGLRAAAIPDTGGDADIDLSRFEIREIRLLCFGESAAEGRELIGEAERFLG